MKDKITIGKIVRPHGIKGELKIIPSLEDLSFLYDIEKLYINNIAYAVQNVKFVGEAVVVKLDGINKIEDAEKLRDQNICVSREDLDELSEDEFYTEDLIGCTVCLDQGKTVGKLVDVQNFGATDILVIRDGSEEFLCPLVADLVETVDLDNQKIILNKAKFLEVVEYED